MFFFRLLFCCFRPQDRNDDESTSRDRQDQRRKGSSALRRSDRIKWLFKTREVPVNPQGIISMVPPPRLLERNDDLVRSHKKNKKMWTEVRVLGKGGYGKVTLIRNKVTKERLAVKKVRNASPSSAEEVIHGQLSHTNIVQLFFWKRNGRTLHMYMEHCRGGSLASRVFHLSKDDAQNYFGQLTAGVGYLHSKGVVHRDIKPGNLLLTARGTLKIADMGLSCLYISNGIEIALTDIVGTPAYMAPEMHSMPSYKGPPVDLWACGVVLFNMLTSAWPWYRALPEDPAFKLWMKQDEELLGQVPWKELKGTPLGPLVFGLLSLNPFRRLFTWRAHLNDPTH